MRHEGVRYIAGGREHEEVLPRGVRHHAEWSGNAPVMLDATLHDVVKDLLLAGSRSEEDAAEHLAEHARRYFFPELCRHGLPLWHDNEPPFKDRTRGNGSCAPAGVPGIEGPAVRVDHVVRMVTSLLAVQDSVYYLRKQRRPLRTQTIDDLLAWPVVRPKLQKALRGQCEGPTIRNVELSRTAVRAVLDGAIRQAPLRVEVSWQTHQRPQPVLSAETVTGLYAFDVLEHVGAAEDEDRTFNCSACQRPYRPGRPPRKGEEHYCSRSECQRVRNRKKQARHRASRQGETGSHGEHSEA